MLAGEGGRRETQVQERRGGPRGPRGSRHHPGHRQVVVVVGAAGRLHVRGPGWRVSQAGSQAGREGGV